MDGELDSVWVDTGFAAIQQLRTYECYPPSSMLWNSAHRIIAALAQRGSRNRLSVDPGARSARAPPMGRGARASASTF